jgi:nucleoside-diphosphate-sugar epimerase
MAKAVVLGGNGQVGSAVARALLAAGWDVTSSSRAEARFPADLREAGVRLIRSDRHDATDLRNLLCEGADVVVDCVAYTADHARMLLPLRGNIGSLVFISSKAVYVDEQGRHSNSVDPPVFCGPVTEEQATMKPSDVDFNSREGYGANKVAAEHVVLDSGMAVSVLRPSRIYGIGSPQPLEWVFVKRVLDGRAHVLLARVVAASTTPRQQVTWRPSWSSARHGRGRES